MTDGAGKTLNQTPELRAIDNIDRQLVAVGWSIQGKSQIDWSCSRGVAVHHYMTQEGTRGRLPIIR